MRYYTPKEFAERVGKTRLTIYRKIAAGVLPAEKIDGKMYIPETALPKPLYERLKEAEHKYRVIGQCATDPVLREKFYTEAQRLSEVTDSMSVEDAESRV